jgi:hydroxymethylglutaryl-CoA reductase (NADPH)
MRFVPKSILRKIYNRSSLRNTRDGVRFSIKNRLSPSTLTAVKPMTLDGQRIDSERVRIGIDGGEPLTMEAFSERLPLDFPLGTLLTFELDVQPLQPGDHELHLAFEASPFGELEVGVTDRLNTGGPAPGTVPRDPEDDYGEAVIRKRQEFVRERTGVELDHVARYSIDPADTRGNIEHFTGVAQIPLGVAGPLRVNGQHADGEFYVPLATTEGTLVASYNRGMKVIHESGGVTCTVVGNNMQRAPVFIFDDARGARRLADWLNEHLEAIRGVCAESDPFVHLKYIDYYLSNRFCFTRFNFTTGDAAGMNMVGKATFAACNWILQNFEHAEIRDFYLEANFATDKKASQINTMRSRGKRVTAECTIKREALLDIMDADTEQIYRHGKVANVGSMLSGANNNGCHAANAITAIFIATGQDVANVSESSTGILYGDLTEDKDLYLSITLPSLIVGTVGGGTGLPTQQEALRIMDCAGLDRVHKFAEIVAGTVLAGEISLAAAISSLDWVSSHDQYGRNDPTRR